MKSQKPKVEPRKTMTTLDRTKVATSSAKAAWTRRTLKKSWTVSKPLTTSASKSRMSNSIHCLPCRPFTHIIPSDAATIKGFPRNLPGVVRREDTTRKDARERRKQRKEEAMATKREEVKRLKALKMRDLRRKLEMIGQEGGKDVDGKSSSLQDMTCR